jgi:hypothetical protein
MALNGHRRQPGAAKRRSPGRDSLRGAAASKPPSGNACAASCAASRHACAASSACLPGMSLRCATQSNHASESATGDSPPVSRARQA